MTFKIIAQDSPVQENLSGVAFVNCMDGIAVGANGAVITTNNGGISWISQTSGFEGGLRDVAFAGKKRMVAVGDECKILISDDSGVTWFMPTTAPLFPSPEKNQLVGINFKDELIGYAVGIAWDEDGIPKALVLTTVDGGDNWKHQFVLPDSTDSFADCDFTILNGISYVVVVGAGTSGIGGLIVRAELGATNWSIIPSQTPNELFGVAFAKGSHAHHGWAVGRNGTIVHTEDGGTTWSVQVSGLPEALLLRVVAIDHMQAWVVGTNGSLIFTNDGGKNWIRHNYESDQQLLDVGFCGPGRGAIVGVSGTILAVISFSPIHVRITPESAQPGESILVEVLDVDGNLLDPSIHVVVNGIRGARQYLQFDSPGKFSVQAVAGLSGVIDQQQSIVNIIAYEWPDIPISESETGNKLLLPETVRRTPLLVGKRLATERQPYRMQFSAMDTLHFTENLSKLFLAARSTGDSDHASNLDTAMRIISYDWDFGDGRSLNTNSDLVDHDYFDSLAPEVEHYLFDVSCKITTQSAGEYIVKRTMSIVNAYAVCRNLGVMSPPVTSVSYARKNLGNFEATVLVRNIEQTPLILKQRRFIYGNDHDNGTQEQMTAIETLAEPIILPPKTTIAVNLSIPFSTIPANVSDFCVVYIGDNNQDHKVHLETLVDVALPDHRSKGLRFGRMAFTQIAASRFEKIASAALARIDTPAQTPTPTPTTVRVSPFVAWNSNKQVFPNVSVSGTAAQSMKSLQKQASLGATSGSRLSLSSGERLFITNLHNTGELDAVSGFTQVSKPMELSTAEPRIGDVLSDKSVMSAIIGTGSFDTISLINSTDTIQAKAVAMQFLEVSQLAKDLIRDISLEVGPQDGKACDPDNRPSGIDSDWSCQIAQKNGQDDIMTWHRHARFDNARKGDLLLAPGGPSGFIGGLLRQVVPPQHYAHIGIMTRNYDMITHSTFSEERLLDEKNGVGSIDIPFLGSTPAPTDGFKPEVLKYGWPGVITQWVKGAVDTGKFADLANMPSPGEPETEIDAIDPDGNIRGDIKPFNKYAAIGDDFEIIPPLVVKPLEETTLVRNRLHQLADAAKAETGKSHYRFFCYSDPTIGLNSTAPPEAGWASGTYPSVCSSFIWLMMSKLAIQMEGVAGKVQNIHLEAPDVLAGAEVVDNVAAVDGLYLYRADERQAAARWLHDKLKHQVSDTLVKKIKDKIGDNDIVATVLDKVIDLTSDISSDVANQMCNTFASDFADTAAKDSDNWQDTGDSSAVSPDNTFFWDPPSKGGLFGLVIPASYTAAKEEQGPRYNWKFVPSKGTLHGIVRYMGQPVSGALVQVEDGLTAFTGSNGQYSLPNVHFGRYEVKAQYDNGIGGPVPGLQTINMNATDQILDFYLVPPHSWYRKVRVSGEFYFMKNYTIGTNPRTTYPFGFEVHVTPDPDGTKAKWPVHNDFHNIYGAANFLFLWQNNGVIDFQVVFAVSQDASLIEDAADDLSSAISTLSLGFVSNLFGSEVNGGDSFGGTIDPNAPPITHGFLIGDPGGTQGRLTFIIENLEL